MIVLQMKTTNESKRVIAFKENTTSIENLPYPLVYYPGFYGTFFGFQKDAISPIYLCSCSKKAIINYIRLKRASRIKGFHEDPCKRFILSSNEFPKRLIEDLLKTNALSTEEIVEDLLFKDLLCHECNNIVPTYRYCHEMYGGQFKQTYGWYIKKQSYEFGVALGGPLIITDRGPDRKGPYLFQIIESECPHSILSLLKSNEVHHIDEDNKVIDYTIDFSQIAEIHHIIENVVRSKFGHRNVGEAWVNETMVFNIVKSLYPEFHTVHHYRPEYLNGLEIDVFIQELNLGIEYQGIQHFRPLSHLGGKEAFEKLQFRDELKQKLCQKQGIRLVYIDYDEDVSESLIISKIKNAK
jgi:hypothetical protein